VPWGKVWCPGADTATTIALSRNMLVGGQPLAAGRYSIWAIPARRVDSHFQPGGQRLSTSPTPARPGRAAAQRKAATGGLFLESLAFYFPAADAERALLNLRWGETIVQVPLAVKERP